MSANALEQESGRGRIKILAVELNFVYFFAISGLLYIVDESRRIPTQIGCRTNKICRNRTFTLRTTGMQKLTAINTAQQFMD